MAELAALAASVLERLGYAGLAVLIALENVFPPVPSEIILPLAGLLVEEGRFRFLPAVLAATLGSVAGALALYALARRVGEARVEQWVADHGRWLLLRPEDLAEGRAWFQRHGSWAVLLGRMAPGVRSLVSLPAGLAGMPLPRFVALTAVGSSVWNAGLIGAGWALGEAAQGGGLLVEALELVVAVAVVALLARFLARRLRRAGAGAPAAGEKR